MEKTKNEQLSCSENNSSIQSKNTRSKLNKSPSSQNKQRRSRSDNIQREHQCACGKGYLSAAALYTHVKQKHDGVTPLSSFHPSTINSRNQNKKDQSEFVEDKSLAVETQIFEKNPSSQIYDEIAEFFQRFYPSSQSQQGLEWITADFPRQIFKKTQDYQGILNTIEDLQKRLKFQFQNHLNPQGINSISAGKSETQFNGKQNREEGDCFSESELSANHTTKQAQKITNNPCAKDDGLDQHDNNDNNNIHKDLHKNIIEMDDGAQQHAISDTQLLHEQWNLDFYDFQRELRITSINNIFAIFIANLNSRICKEAVLEVIIFIALLRKILNDCGDQICPSQLPLFHQSLGGEQHHLFEDNNIKIENDENGDTNEEQHREFCEINCGEHLAEIANVFIIKCQEQQFKQIFTENWSKDFKILGETDEGIKNICLLLRLLLQWMNAFKFADSTLEFNEEKDENMNEESKKHLRGNQDCCQTIQQEKKTDAETCLAGTKGGDEILSFQENSKKQAFDEDPILRDEQEGQLEDQAMLANLSSGLSLIKPSDTSQFSYQSSYGNILQNSNIFPNSIYDQNGSFSSMNSNLQLNNFYNPKSTSFLNQNPFSPFGYSSYFAQNKSTSFAQQDQFGFMNKFGSSETPQSLSSAPFFKPSQFSFYNSITPTAAGQTIYPQGQAICSPYAAFPFPSTAAFEVNFLKQQQLQQLEMQNRQLKYQQAQYQRNLDMHDSSFA